jgi:hypothetical protein
LSFELAKDTHRRLTQIFTDSGRGEDIETLITLIALISEESKKLLSYER